MSSEPGPACSTSGVAGHATSRDLLILDDDGMVGMLIDTVARLAGMASRVTESRADFFAALEASPPSHIVLDLTLTGCNGEQVLDELAHRGCDARIVLTSGAAADRLQSALHRAARLGLRIAGSLPKPFSPQALRTLLA